MIVSILMVSAIIAHITGKDISSASLNEYDTYNPECPRIRRPWHKLTKEERDIYTSGLLKLRQNGNLNLDEDELAAIASVHEDPLAFTHQTSAYLFWHGYLVWELESRIRNLGGEYSCFGMPYWDFTLEAGRETNPTIFEQDIGGNGDPDNYWTVNEYSWFPTIEEYWVPYNCAAKDDEYPLCSLKRVLNLDFSMPTAEQIGSSIINNPNFVDFADYSHISGSAVHLIDAHPDDMSEIPDFPQAFEPIWYLFHSAIQFHQALWTDCNDYDLINVDDLHLFPDAFTSFCNSYNGCDDDKYGTDRGNLNGVQWGLDDALQFGGTLGSKEWSYIYDKELTVRKLYMIPTWNIIYDLDDGQGFYTTSGLADYCRGKLNNHWFMVDKLDDNDNGEKQQREEILSATNYLSSSIANNNWLIAGFVIVFIAFTICYLWRMNNKNGYQNVKRYKSTLELGNYGSV